MELDVFRGDISGDWLGVEITMGPSISSCASGPSAIVDVWFVTVNAPSCFAAIKLEPVKIFLLRDRIPTLNPLIASLLVVLGSFTTPLTVHVLHCNVFSLHPLKF